MYNGHPVIGIWDFILTPFILFLIFIISGRSIRTKLETEPIYEFYMKGLMLRLAGSIGFCLVYVFYYGGGDTINYWGSGCTLNRMLNKNLLVYFDILFGDLSWDNYAQFDLATSHPEYMLRDAKAFAVVRFVAPFCLVTIKSYVSATLLVAWFTYSGIWRLYKVFTELFPSLRRQMAYTALFVPSVSFWGGGILKDTFSLWGACLFFYGFYMLFFKGGGKLKYSALLIIASYVILSLKPYIFQAMLPTCAGWYFVNRLKAVESGFAKALIAPFFLAVGVIFIALVFNQVQGSLGDFSSLDKSIEKAKVTQTDLKRSEYGGNSFDIGTFDGSPLSAAKLFPAAVFAGMFRPTILDVRNPVMFVSALENLMLLYLFLQTVYMVGIGRFISLIRGEPLLVFTISFSILMAFSVGLTTSNFGSLVRYRIPIVPFFFSSMFVIRYLKQKTDFEEANPGLVFQAEVPPVED